MTGYDFKPYPPRPRLTRRKAGMSTSVAPHTEQPQDRGGQLIFPKILSLFFFEKVRHYASLQI